MAALSYDLAQFPRSVQRAVAAQPDPALAQESVMDEAVRVMRGPSSFWPVATGRSKRAWRVTGSGLFSRLYNPTRYASFVEASPHIQPRQPARATLRRFARRLVRAARRGQPLTGQQRRQDRRLAILEAAGVRQQLEEVLSVRERLFVPLRRRQRGVVRTPREVRELQRAISQVAARFPGIRRRDLIELLRRAERRVRGR